MIAASISLETLMTAKPETQAEKRGDRPSPSLLLARARYTAAQSLRVVWYASHYRLARSLSSPLQPPAQPAASAKEPKSAARAFQRRFRDLFEQDRANIEAGLYPAPRDLNLARLWSTLNNSLRFFEDLPAVDSRRTARNGIEVREQLAGNGHYPAYYLQNFHYQSGGWLTQESAKLYDTQVEILFGGAADAMRRIALGALARAWRGADHRHLKLLDVACGNGRFLSQALEAFPRLTAHGLDLSPAYIEEARARLRPWPKVDVAMGMAEAMPMADASFDAATCIYLFHELPPKVRPMVAREIGRVVKPGGIVILADSLQMRDAPELDDLLELFPSGFHEPFYNSYLKEDLVRMMGQAGLVLDETRLAFLTKVMRFRKQGG